MRLLAIFTGASDARTACRSAPTARALRILLLATTTLIAAPLASGATPDSPEVKQMVAKGVKYIGGTKAIASSFGGASLRGLALVKGGAPLDHRLIKHAIDLTRVGIKRAHA